MSDIPSDIHIRILTCLPVKSLMRFKCVCRDWLALFGEVDFIRSYRQKQMDTGNVFTLVKHGGERIGVEDAIRRSTRSSMVVVGDRMLRSSRFSALEDGGGGMIAIAHMDSVSEEYMNPRRLFYSDGLICFSGRDPALTSLWNPATREFRQLPPSSVERPHGTAETSFLVIGFGYNPRNEDYIIIRLAMNNSSDTNSRMAEQLELYSLKHNLWREITTDYSLPLSRFRMVECVSMDGVLYWSFGARVVFFNLDDEVFGGLTVPYFRADGYGRTALLTLNGSLAFIVYPRYRAGELHIWVKGCGAEDSWIEQTTVVLTSALGRPLGFWKTGGLFFSRCRWKTRLV